MIQTTNDLSNIVGGTNVNHEYYLERIIEANTITEPIIEEQLYENVDKELLRKFFSLAHHEINRLLRYLNSRISNGHYNANESRELLHWIDVVEKATYSLGNTEMSFLINEDYWNVLIVCKDFLQETSGSPIPTDFKKFNLKEYEAIFQLVDTVEIGCSNNKTQYPLKQIGEGSYAIVYKYKDEYYNKQFALKRAKKGLNEKELERFHREFTIMDELKSPYVIDVFRYDKEHNEYIMEYAHETLEKFISKNNNRLSISDRKVIANQILRGFEYIHLKGYLHRDISFTNILLQHFDGISVVKISDFGLVKTRTSTLTSFGTEFKGSLNDGQLQIIGFDKYTMLHETFALTRLIYYVMTGRENIERATHVKHQEFIAKGTHPDLNSRYKSVEELREAYRSAFA